MDSPGRAVRIVVVQFSGRGGMIHYAFQLCRGLARRGADVTLVTDRRYELAELETPFRVERIFDLWDPKPPGPVPARLADRLARRARRIPRAWRYYRQWWRLIRFLRRERPDVVQFGDIRFPTDLVPLAVVRRIVPRMADVCHNVRPFAVGGRHRGGFRRSRIERLLYRRIYRLFDLVVVHHEASRGEFLATFGLDPADVLAVPLGNMEIFRELDGSTGSGAEHVAALRRRLEIPAEDRILLMFGTMSRYKGIGDMVRALARIRRRRGDVHLVVVGYPSQEFDVEAVRRRARDLGVGDAVRLLPEYVESEAVATWMRLADIAVFPYRAVYQSAALQVALTFGAPVVATRAGAIPEVVEDGVNGLLARPRSAGELADAVLRLLDDPGCARRLGERARRDARTRFAWSRVAASLMRRYEGWAGRSPAAAGRTAREGA